MDVREAFDTCKRLGISVDLALTEPVEIRFSESLPGMGGKLHVVPVVPEDVDPLDIPCGTFFESEDEDAGPCDAARLMTLLDSGRLCTVCLGKLRCVNNEFFALVDQVADRINQHASMLESSLAGEQKNEGPDAVMLGYLASNHQRLDRLVESAKTMQGYEVIEKQVNEAVVRSEAAFTELMEAVKKRPEFDEKTTQVLSAIDADLAKR